jgi:hypothetical protein
MQMNHLAGILARLEQGGNHPHILAAGIEQHAAAAAINRVHGHFIAHIDLGQRRAGRRKPDARQKSSGFQTHCDRPGYRQERLPRMQPSLNLTLCNNYQMPHISVAAHQRMRE